MNIPLRDMGYSSNSLKEWNIVKIKKNKKKLFSWDQLLIIVCLLFLNIWFICDRGNASIQFIPYLQTCFFK